MRTILALSFIVLIMHGLWEQAHSVLYTGYEAMEGALPVWMLATLGDLFYTLIIIGIISLAKGGSAWVGAASWRDCLAAAVLGALVALMVEYKGLYLGRWEYLPSMPVLPLLSIGLSPLLQMTLLTPLSLWLVRRFESFR
ncbi:MAG TPA: hypothetical protein VJ837_02265 [Candidatus Paceibacterota bacterium]|nr:hypothetical protein [Candidatus Paceibacterota bacterium]